MQTAVLTISSAMITDGKEIAQLMLESGVICNIVDNWSVVEKEGDGFIVEKGCVITLCGLPNDQIEKKVWNVLKERFGLSCAYLHIKGQFRGCIRNFLKDSSCPGSEISVKRYSE